MYTGHAPPYLLFIRCICSRVTVDGTCPLTIVNCSIFFFNARPLASFVCSPHIDLVCILNIHFFESCVQELCFSSVPKDRLLSLASDSLLADHFWSRSGGRLFYILPLLWRFYCAYYSSLVVLFFYVPAPIFMFLRLMKSVEVNITRTCCF